MEVVIQAYEPKLYVDDSISITNVFKLTNLSYWLIQYDLEGQSGILAQLS
jgi:hypothetical protein